MRVLTTAAALTALLPVGLAVAAGNFEFIVPAEPGLALTITLYATDGSEMIRVDTSGTEQRGGQSVYVVRVDETIIHSRSMGMWCVQDSTGKWKESGNDSGIAVCDDHPSETRGSYLFKPGSRKAVATSAEPVAPPVIDVPTMSKSEAAACVQEQLNALGYDAGPVDGQMGRMTAAAALVYAATQQDEPLPALDDVTAPLWCVSLKAGIAEGTAVAAPDRIAAFRFGADINAATAKDTMKGIEDAHAYFVDTFGAGLATPGTIYVSSDAKWMTDSYLKHLKLGESFRRGKMEHFEGCHGGEAGYGFMFMCARSDVFSGDWFGAGKLAQRTFALTHEYFHMLQYELAADSADGCCSGNNSVAVLGPQWLVEGAAEYTAFRILADSGRMNFDREISWHTQKAEEVKSNLEQMTTREGFYAEPKASSSGMIAAHVLATKTGMAALPEFWRQMGRGQDWEKAFESAFGMTPESFYEIYEAALR